MCDSYSEFGWIMVEQFWRHVSLTQFRSRTPPGTKSWFTKNRQRKTKLMQNADWTLHIPFLLFRIGAFLGKVREQTFKISKWTKVYFWFDKKEIIKFVRVDDWCPPISKVVLNHIVIWRKFVFISLFSGLRLCVVRDLHLTCINFFFAIIIKNFDDFTLELNFLRPTAGELNQIFLKIQDSHIFYNLFFSFTLQLKKKK